MESSGNEKEKLEREGSRIHENNDQVDLPSKETQKENLEDSKLKAISKEISQHITNPEEVNTSSTEAKKITSEVASTISTEAKKLSSEGASTSRTETKDLPLEEATTHSTEAEALVSEDLNTSSSKTKELSTEKVSTISSKGKELSSEEENTSRITVKKLLSEELHGSSTTAEELTSEERNDNTHHQCHILLEQFVTKLYEEKLRRKVFRAWKECILRSKSYSQYGMCCCQEEIEPVCTSSGSFEECDPNPCDFDPCDPNPCDFDPCDPDPCDLQPCDPQCQCRNSDTQ